jgi:hypothetical protein
MVHRGAASIAFSVGGLEGLVVLFLAPIDPWPAVLTTAFILALAITILSLVLRMRKD